MKTYDVQVLNGAYGEVMTSNTFYDYREAEAFFDELVNDGAEAVDIIRCTDGEPDYCIKSTYD